MKTKLANKVPLATMFSDFPLALAAVAEVTEFGNKKYTPKSWVGLDNFVENYQNAKARHAIAGLVDPHGKDSESGLLHLAHEAWNVLALLEHQLRVKTP